MGTVGARFPEPLNVLGHSARKLGAMARVKIKNKMTLK